MGNIVCVTPDRDGYIKPIEKFLNHDLIFVRTPNSNEILSYNPLCVLFLADWIYEYTNTVNELKSKNIPTILMMDGTIELKNLIENPRWTYGNNPAPYFPVYCDKVLVPGKSTFRFLEFFGCQGKCEITGQPRFDTYVEILKNLKTRTNNGRVLGVMSGNTPGYTDLQIEETIKLFEDLHHYCDAKGIKVRWRLRKGFQEKMNVKVENDNSPSLQDFINTVDAIISQPSTAAYEAMIMGVPVALADYNIAPNYMTASWFIHSSDQIDRVLKEIFTPSSFKILNQKQILEDSISFIGKSAKITAGVVNDLADLKENNNFNTQDVPTYLFAKHIGSSENSNYEFIEPFDNKKGRFSESFLYEEYISKQKKFINELEQKLSRRNLGFWIEKIIRKITEK